MHFLLSKLSEHLQWVDLDEEEEKEERGGGGSKYSHDTNRSCATLKIAT